MRVRVFTDEDRKWLLKNYPHLTNTECYRYLKCSHATFKAFVKECGLTYKSVNKSIKERPLTPKKNKWQESDCGGYCIDCHRYVIGGSCAKTGKAVGALWQKKCFRKA